MSERSPPVPPELGCLSTFIDTHIECLAGSSSELRTFALCAAEHVFDWALGTEKSSIPHLGTLLATLSEAAPPQTRSRAFNTSTQMQIPSLLQKSRMRTNIRETPLPSLFIEGMNTDQIWQQLDLRAARICENLRALQGEGEDEDTNLGGEDSDLDGSEDEDEEDEGVDLGQDDDDDAEMNVDDESLREEFSDGEGDGSSAAEGGVDLQEENSDDEEDHGPPTSMSDFVRRQEKQKPSGSYQGHPDLDDGFFDLATFNAETSAAEAKEASKSKPNGVVDEDSTEESELDLFDSIDNSTIEGVDDGFEPTEPFYNDFFEPPRTQKRSNRSSKVRFHERVSVKKIKAVGKGMPVSTMDDDSDEDSDEEDTSDGDPKKWVLT